MTSVFIKSHIRSEVKGFLQLAIPLASAQVAQSATGFVDTIMMGRLGQESLAAGGLAALTFQMLLNATSGVVMGASPLVAEAFGAGRKTRIEQIARQGMWLSVILFIPVMLLIGHLDTFMGQLGQAPTTVTLANKYLDFMLWGFFPALGFAMLRGVVSGLSQARPVMVIVIAGTVVNQEDNYLWAVCITNNHELIGMIELSFKQSTDASLHYEIAHQHWNKGFATEAVKAVIAWAFENLPQIISIKADTHSANFGSQRVMEKSGMNRFNTAVENWDKYSEPVEVLYYQIKRS
jgi:MatE/Acetyltransferase (GNAT) domain